jgi:hypothetical protein
MLGSRNDHVTVPNVLKVEGQLFVLSSVSTNNKFGTDSRQVAMFRPTRQIPARARGNRKRAKTDSVKKVEVSMAVIVMPNRSKTRPGYTATEIRRTNGHFVTCGNKQKFPALINDSF